MRSKIINSLPCFRLFRSKSSNTFTRILASDGNSLKRSLLDEKWQNPSEKGHRHELESAHVIERLTNQPPRSISLQLVYCLRLQHSNSLGLYGCDNDWRLAMPFWEHPIHLGPNAEFESSSDGSKVVNFGNWRRSSITIGGDIIQSSHQLNPWPPFALNRFFQRVMWMNENKENFIALKIPLY